MDVDFRILRKRRAELVPGSWASNPLQHWEYVEEDVLQFRRSLDHPWMDVPIVEEKDAS
jgi:hypothetical protein